MGTGLENVTRTLHGRRAPFSPGGDDVQRPEAAGGPLMPTPRPDRRRSARVERRLPLMVESAGRLSRVVTTEISRHGAGILCRLRARPGQLLHVANLDLLRDAAFRVVRSEELADGYSRLGVEIVDTGADLWGDAYAS